MRATTIQLYSRRMNDDAGEPAYCGCWWIPCADGDPRIKDMDRLNLGRALMDDGTVTRSFFFADEIDEMVARAERETECFAETPWEYGEVAATQEP